MDSDDASPGPPSDHPTGMRPHRVPLKNPCHKFVNGILWGCITLHSVLGRKCNVSQFHHPSITSDCLTRSLQSKWTLFFFSLLLLYETRSPISNCLHQRVPKCSEILSWDTWIPSLRYSLRSVTCRMKLFQWPGQPVPS